MTFMLTTELGGSDCKYKEGMLTMDSVVNHEHNNSMSTLFPLCFYVSASLVSLKSQKY
jgi:hypothetical protein